MEIRFYLVQITGEKVSDMTNYDAGIFDILAHVTDEHDEVILGDNWFSLSRVPTLEEILIINRNLVKTVVGEVVRGLAVLEAEHGLDRNYYEVGGYSLIADTMDDLSRAREIFDDRKHYCEWSTKLGDSGFCSALYLLSNEFSVMLYIPISLANEDILQNMED